MEFPLEKYQKFNIRKFINKLLYKERNIEVPTARRCSTITEFRNKTETKKGLFQKFIVKILVRILKRKDDFLSLTDASMIAKAILDNLSVVDLEYFYNLWEESVLSCIF